MKHVVFALATFVITSVCAQIVNVEAMRGAAESDTTQDVHGRVDGGFYLGGTQALLLKLNGSVNMSRRTGGSCVVRNRQCQLGHPIGK